MPLLVRKCIREGKLECAEYTLDESLIVMQIMDSFRQQALGGNRYAAAALRVWLGTSNDSTS